MKQYDAYVFDLYGTLVDIHTDEHIAAPWKALADYAASCGAHYRLPELRESYLRLCAAQEEKLRGSSACPEIDLQPVFAALLSEKGVFPEKAIVREAAWRFRQASTSHLRLYAGAKELLEALGKSGSYVLLLSNAQALFTRPELRLLGIDRAFDRVDISSDRGCRKPDPAFFQTPLNALDLDPARCLMIGNDPDCDIRGAAAVGMDSVYLHSGLSPVYDPGAPATWTQRGMDLKKLMRILLE